MASARIVRMMLKLVLAAASSLLFFLPEVFAGGGRSADQVIEKKMNGVELGENSHESSYRSPPAESENIEYIIVPVSTANNESVDRYADTALSQDSVRYRVEKAPQGSQHQNPNETHSLENIDFLKK